MSALKKVMKIRLRASGCNEISEVVFIGKVCYWHRGDFKIYYWTDTFVDVCVSVLDPIFRITCLAVEKNIH